VIKPVKTYVICAAVRIDGQVFLGYNHADIIKNLADANPDIYIRQDMQGFMLNTGQFCMRPAAYCVAVKAGQTKNNNRVLLSEDTGNRLWRYSEINLPEVKP
jgi:hypothetical protein